MEKKRYEEVAYVLDFLPEGKPVSGRNIRREPLVQIMGEEFFTLLEATLKPGVSVVLHERVYIGKENRDKVNHVIGRISYEELTPTAKAELPIVIEKIVKSNEKRFVEFFNKAQPVSPRMHVFELLPGIGKKYMWQIINEREREPFKSFEDIQKRTGIPDPVKVISKRIIEELTSNQRYRIFTRHV